MSMYQIMALAWSDVEWAVMQRSRTGAMLMNHILMEVRAERIQVQELKPWQRIARR